MSNYDYDVTNEHRVLSDGRTEPSGEVFGYSEITRQYHQRYRIPVMHTETNLSEGPTGQEGVNWLWKEWANVLRVCNIGIPVVGLTWYSITDQIDWDTALRSPTSGSARLACSTSIATSARLAGPTSS